MRKWRYYHHPPFPDGQPRLLGTEQVPYCHTNGTGNAREERDAQRAFSRCSLTSKGASEDKPCSLCTLRPTALNALNGWARGLASIRLIYIFIFVSNLFHLNRMLNYLPFFFFLTLSAWWRCIFSNYFVLLAQHISFLYCFNFFFSQRGLRFF